MSDSDSHSECETLDGSDDPLLRALARTPAIGPFTGTERFKVERCLGEGGFGIVYEVEDREMCRRLALKTLRPDGTGFAVNIRRLKREFRAVADLVHENLVGLHELTSDGSHWFFTMDLVRGRDIMEYVCGQRDAHPRTERDTGDTSSMRRDLRGTFSEPRLRSAFRQLVTGVAALHEAGIIHRDLKPSNVLVEPDGRVVILDFGLAGNDIPSDVDLSVRFAGTPMYMAPEQASGKPLTEAADFYAVGVMLYEALTGRAPFEDSRTHLELLDAKCGRDPAPPSQSGRVPSDLEALCLALLQRDPAARPRAAALLDLLGETGHTPASRRRGGTRRVFVGRIPELVFLRKRYLALRRGEASVVRVHGQPGVGKSALLARFVDELHEQGEVVVLAGRCHEREFVPFKAFDGIADALVNYLRSLPRNEGSALMPRDIHLATQLFPVFSGVPAVRDVPRRQGQVPDPGQARFRAFAAIKELVARIADKQPLVIAIDDLQWSDVDSARLLAQLVAAPERPALLLILLYRSGDEEQGPTLVEAFRALDAAGERGDELALSPLPREDAQRLARTLLGSSDQAAEAARIIAHRSDGHPLFMEELARASRLDDRAAPPPTLMDILWERVFRLSDSARALLETLAVAGQPLPQVLCFEAAGLRGAGVDAVRALRAARLVRTGDAGSINVFHDRVRDTVLAHADAGTRRTRHLALARTLERRPDCDLETLARHYDAADEHELAARYAVSAGDAAARALAFDRAAGLYEMAIARRGSDALPALYEKLGDALRNAGSGAAAGAVYLAAAGRTQGSYATDLRRRGAEQLLCLGDLETGMRALEQALGAVGESLPDGHMAWLRFYMDLLVVRLNRYRFRPRDAALVPAAELLRLDVLDSATEVLSTNHPAKSFAAAARYCRRALSVGEPKRAACGLVESVYGLLSFRPERPARIDAILDRAEAIGHELEEPEVLGRATAMRATSHFCYSDWSKAAELCERAAGLVAERCVGRAGEYHKAMWMAAISRCRLGQLGEAERIGEARLRDAVERGNPVMEKAYCGAVMAPLRLTVDDPESAQDFVTRVGTEDRCVSVMFRAESAAAIAMYESRPRDAIQAWRSRWRQVQAYGILTIPSWRVITTRSLGMALLTGAKNRREVREAARLARGIDGYRFPHAAAVYATLRAYLALHEGRIEHAGLLLADAVRKYDEAKMPLEANACRRRHGLLVGGEEGEGELAAADAELRARGIVSPERWTAMMCPAPSIRFLTAG